MGLTFETFFKIISYFVALCGLFALFSSGSVGIEVSAVFFAIILLAWFIEGTRWQISEKTGIFLVFAFIPIFYLDWKFEISGLSIKEAAAASSLAQLILILAAIKLLQNKNDRDWIFIYLISFFQILLAAGLSISPFFILSLILYLLCVVCAIVALEIRKSSRFVQSGKTRRENYLELNKKTLFRLPVTSVGLLFAVTIFAIPLFFSLPRVGGAGFGKQQTGTSTGFSDSIRLGEIARIQQNNEIVMRVNIEPQDRGKVDEIKWRGIALDYFDGRGWNKSIKDYNEPFVNTEQNLFQIDYAKDIKNLVAQRIFQEPLDTPILFSLSRPVAVQGGFQLVKKDREGAISVLGKGAERFSYTVFSDVTKTPIEKLRADDVSYSQQHRRYLQLPKETDERISKLAVDITEKSGAVNRYDKARSIENYLQNNFAYTLDLKASGEQPVADFLFNVREGHCEYFATAMALMLRTQGIATRVVTGFQAGEFNERAEVFIVRQREAHAWVEVYFPKENSWVTFDPTPAAGQFSETADSTSLFSSIGNYVEALETFWIQYVVSYDNQEQKSLMRSLKNNIQDTQIQLSTWTNLLQMRIVEWWKEVRGDKGFEQSAWAIGIGILYLVGIIILFKILIWVYKKSSKSKIWRRLANYFKRKNDGSIVEFYERMQNILANKGLIREPHQTPLEFAVALNLPEAVRITEKYNQIRFGEARLNSTESAEIEVLLQNLQRFQPEIGKAG